MSNKALSFAAVFLALAALVTVVVVAVQPEQEPMGAPVYHGSFIAADSDDYVKLWDGADLVAYSDEGSTQTFALDGATGNFTMGGAFDLNGKSLKVDADADTTIAEASDDNISLTSGAAAGVWSILTGNFKVGNGTPTQAQDGEDAYVEGMLEVDGNLYADGLTYGKTDAIAKTASYTVTVAETGSLFHNLGATAEITLTLPSAVEGLNYCVYVYAAYTITLELDGADQIHHLTNAAGDRLQNIGTAGDSVCLSAIDTTYWVPLQEIGTWTDIN